MILKTTDNLKHLIVIIGPTASGKTALSVRLAKHYNCEIVSADSRQIFKELNIGTAKPNLEEMEGVPHHFIGNISITEDYTAGKFEKDAIKKLNKLYATNDVVILVGGSGLYIDAVCNGFDYVPSNLTIRKKITEQFEEKGITFLQKELIKNDLEYYKIVDKQNPHRLIRGIEVFRTSGKPYSSFLKKEKIKRPFNCIKIALDIERKKLYDRINNRVDIMFATGLENEVKALIPFKNKMALKTVGYSELFDFFDKKTTKEETINLIKRNSRRYAKRQITWFKRDQNTTWLPPSSLNNIINHIRKTQNFTINNT